MWGLTRRQWLVVFAAWLGWGFDVFDAVLFNFVAPNAIPTLLGLTPGTPEAKAATLQWNGLLSALLLVVWAIGGVLFGYLADRIGRVRALTWSILLYASGTAACAAAPNLETLVACRIVASLGIGGEWAAGVTLVAEAVPENRRLQMAALLQTASPLGLFLATFTTWFISGQLMPDRPDLSWRFVFLCGLAPILVAVVFRWFIREPEGFVPAAARSPLEGLRELLSPQWRRATFSGFSMAALGLLSWWSVNAFMPTLAVNLAHVRAAETGLTGVAAQQLAEGWKAQAGFWFNLGGLLGALLTVPLAARLGRRSLFTAYYGFAALAMVGVFGLVWAPEWRLTLVFFIGLSLYGVFAAFNFYLPELFPPRLRGLGAGFSYNIGRILAAFGPFLVGAYSAAQTDPVAGALQALMFLAVMPFVAALLSRFIVETRGLAERGG